MKGCGWGGEGAVDVAEERAPVPRGQRTRYAMVAAEDEVKSGRRAEEEDLLFTKDPF